MCYLYFVIFVTSNLGCTRVILASSLQFLRLKNIFLTKLLSRYRLLYSKENLLNKILMSTLTFNSYLIFHFDYFL